MKKQLNPKFSELISKILSGNERRFINRGVIGILDEDGISVVHVPGNPHLIYVLFNEASNWGNHIAEWPKDRIAPGVKLVYGVRVGLTEFGFLEPDF